MQAQMCLNPKTSAYASANASNKEHKAFSKEIYLFRLLETFKEVPLIKRVKALMTRRETP